MTKTCTKCGIEKDPKEFSKHSSTKDGLQFHCKLCLAAYRAANKEAIAKAQAAYISTHKENIARQTACYRAENREAIAKQKAVWHQLNKETIAQKRSVWYSANREPLLRRKADKRKDKIDRGECSLCSTAAEQGRTMCSRHLAQYKERFCRRRSSVGSWLGEEVADRMAAINRLGCFYCDGGDEHRDHVVPLARGGHNYASNIVPACEACNKSKGATPVSLWLKTTTRPVRPLADILADLTKLTKYGTGDEQIEALEVLNAAREAK